MQYFLGPLDLSNISNKYKKQSRSRILYFTSDVGISRYNPVGEEECQSRCSCRYRKPTNLLPRWLSFWISELEGWNPLSRVVDDLLWNVYTNADKKDNCYTISKHNVAYIYRNFWQSHGQNFYAKNEWICRSNW